MSEAHRRQRDFLLRVVREDPPLDAGPIPKMSLRSLIANAPLDDSLQTEALYYKACLDLSYAEKELCSKEIASMAGDLGIDPFRAPVVIGKHSFQSAWPLLAGDDMEEIKHYIESRFVAKRLLGRDLFDNPSSALTPYFLGQIIRLLCIQNLFSAQEEYLSARLALPEILARAEELSYLGHEGVDSEVLIISADADVIGFFDNAYAVHLGLDDAEGKEHSLIIAPAFATQSDQDREAFARVLAHEMIHAQQNFAALDVKQIPKDELTLWSEALTDALIFLRMPEMDFAEEGYASIVISLLEILESLHLDAEDYLLWANTGTLACVLEDLSARMSLTPAELSQRFMSRFRELARLRRGGELLKWSRAARVIARH